MATPKLTPFFFVMMILCLASGSHHHDLSSSSSSSSLQLGWISGGVGECKGTIAECLGGDGDDEEFDLGSETSRRMLAARRYISYDALRRDSVPCSRRGASYYNCRPGAQANPYSRGCSAITRCRG